MSIRGKLYILGVLAAAVLSLAWVSLLFDASRIDWFALAVMTGLATISQLYEAKHGRQSYYPHLVFFFAGVLLIQPLIFAVVVLVPHLAESVNGILKNKPRRSWYIQPFNIASHLLSGYAANYLVHAFGASANTPSGIVMVVHVILAAIAYVGLNHLLVGYALFFVRNVPLKDSGILGLDSIIPDLVMIFLGAVVALLWQLHPAWITLALAPLMLMYQALLVPQLKQLAQSDAKTGLFNARHFQTVFASELERAQQFRRPLALIVADLDFLRNINNTYGHLAGDKVIVGIGETIRNTIRPEDIAGRFGGEEFTIILPETEVEGARVLAERLRNEVSAVPYDINPEGAPVHVTISIGVACYPGEGNTPSELFAAADAAVYKAKANGRNQVVFANDLTVALNSAGEPIDTVPVLSAPALLPMPSGHPDKPTSETVLLQQLSALTQAPQLVVAEPVRAQSANPIPAQTAPSEEASESPPLRSTKHGFHPLFWFLVSGVIASGSALTLLGLLVTPIDNFFLLGALMLIAFVTEFLHINVYNKNTISASVALAYAAALLVGLPGVSAVSFSIVVAHAIRRKAVFYRAAYNWSTHVLAGGLPVLAFSLMGLPLNLDNITLLSVPLAIAAVGYYLVDTGLIASAISLATRQNTITVWREQFEWIFVHYLTLCALGLFMAYTFNLLSYIGLMICLLPLFLTRYAQQQYVSHTEASMDRLQQMNRDLHKANRSIQDLNDELFETLARFFDARDPSVGSHAAVVGEYATAIAKELGIEGSRLKQIRQAGFLHDIGKIAIPEQILHKPSSLTDTEYMLMKTHAAIGARLLEQSLALAHLAPFVRYHHERWDGFGYPDGLKGEQIPLEARILNVCDSVEAMSSDRLYRRGMSIPEVIAELRRGSGGQFDPLVVEAFLAVLAREGDSFIVNSARTIQHQSDVDRILRMGEEFSQLLEVKAV